MNRIVYNYLKEKRMLSIEEDGIAINSVATSNSEIVLSGNKIGLIMLADYIIDIALSGAKSHIHLDEENFFDSADKQLIIELTKN